MEGDRAEEHPRVYTAIRVRVRVRGDVQRSKVERALQLSHETYCSVSAMLSSTATITHELQIVEPDRDGAGRAGGEETP